MATIESMFTEAQTTLFFKHVTGFVLDHYPHHSRNVVVAVSGGVDSMMLMKWANEFLKQGHLDSLRVLTVNHGTRPVEQDVETAAVKFEAEKLELSCDILKVALKDITSNVENTLRLERHKLLKEALLEGEELWMGHHLDDSWEWSQLQSARSGDVNSALGIPFKSGVVVRPFLCVTRLQISRCARQLRLLWSEDPTNTDTHFERNWIRHEWGPALKKRHPQYLKHYARRSQKLAETLGLALRAKKKAKFSYTKVGRSSKATSARADSLS